MADGRARVGVIGRVPCPICSGPTVPKSAHPLLRVPAVGFAGLVLLFPLTARYHCREHGPLPFDLFGEGSGRVFWIRRVAFMVAGAAALAALLTTLFAWPVVANL